MLKAALLTLFIASVWRTVVGNDGDPYTMLSAINTECEFLGLTIGTRLCDSFNSYDEFSNQDRLHHDYMFNQDPHNAAFVRLLHSDRHRHVRGEKRNVTSHVPPNRVERVHHHVNASASIFHAIANKWIYFLGDYSLAPLYRSLLGPLHAHDKKWEFNAWMKQKCLNREHSETLGDNVLCHTSGYGQDGALTYERQDFLLEKLGADWLRNHSVLGIGSESNSQPRPDLLVIQMGRMGCFLAHNGSNADESQVKLLNDKAHNIAEILKMVVKTHRALHDANTTVIFSLPSRNHLDNHASNVCTWNLNRIIAFAAHLRNIVVLEREELEHRLLFKSEFSNPSFLKPQPDLDTPAPQMLTASLLSIYTCVLANTTFVLQ